MGLIYPCLISLHFVVAAAQERGSGIKSSDLIWSQYSVSSPIVVASNNCDHIGWL